MNVNIGSLHGFKETEIQIDKYLSDCSSAYDLCITTITILLVLLIAFVFVWILAELVFYMVDKK